VTNPTRFLFDECLSKPVVENDIVNSLRLFGSEVEIAHLLTKFGNGGIGDAVWIPKIAQEGGWVIFTCDQGKKSKKSEKLPEICRAYGVTHVMLSQKIHKRTMYYKALAIQSHWATFLKIADEQPGAGYQIHMKGENGFKVVRVSDALPATEVAINPSAIKNQASFLDG